MGEVSIGFYNLSLVNPAASHGSSRASFGASFQSEMLFSQTSEGSMMTAGTNLPFFRLAFPIHNSAELGIGVAEMNNFNARFSGQAGTFDGMPYKEWAESTGGINGYSASIAAELGDFLSFGFQYDYLMGNSTENWYLQFDDGQVYTDSSEDSVSIISTHDISKNTFIGGRLRAGVLSGSFRGFRLGAYLAMEAELTGSTLLKAANSEYVSWSERTYTYPAALGMGASMVPADGLVLALDWERIFWTDLKIDGSGPAGTNDSDRISIGFEWFPRSGKRKKPGTIPLRLGYSRVSGYFPDPVTGNAISENRFSAGSGFLLPEQSGRIDFALAYTARGSLPSTSLKEDQITFFVSLTGQEIWSRKYAE